MVCCSACCRISSIHSISDTAFTLLRRRYHAALLRHLNHPCLRQCAGTTPYVYELQNMVIWGMGVMLGVAALAGLLWLCWRVWKRDAGSWLVVLSWVLVYGALTGSFYAKFMRYMLPIYPFLAL